jgi:hypothetical protein
MREWVVHYTSYHDLTGKTNKDFGKRGKGKQQCNGGDDVFI